MWKSACVGVYQLLNWKMQDETLKFGNICNLSLLLSVSVTDACTWLVEGTCSNTGVHNDLFRHYVSSVQILRSSKVR